MGAFEDLAHYYASIGDITLISDPKNSGGDSYSVEEYFYNKNSQDEFLVNEQGEYTGVEAKEYIYMAIPISEDIIMDDISLYMCSDSDCSVYISCYIVDELPNKIRGMGAPISQTVENNGEQIEETITYDDPIPLNSVFNTVLHLKAGEWDSFTGSRFELTKGVYSKNCELPSGKIFLIQFRNNSGIESLVENTESKIDSLTGVEVKKASFTMTNLMIRAVETVETEGN